MFARYINIVLCCKVSQTVVRMSAEIIFGSIIPPVFVCQK